MKISQATAPALAGLAAIALAGCSGAAAPSTSGSTGAEEKAYLTVFAAASLTDVMKTLTAKYTSEHPGVDFKFNYGASSTLVQQLSNGAKADVLVTADQSSMDSIKGSGVLDQDVTVVASNQIVLAVAPGNPGNISSLDDATKSNKIAVCAPAVPCGKAAKRVLDAAHLTLNNPSQEQDVSAVRTKVSSGQVDAGFVYSTDVKATQKQGVSAIELKDPQPNKYPAALTKDAAGKPAAVGFKKWLSSPEAAAILAEAGFGPGASDSTSSTSSSTSTASATK